MFDPPLLFGPFFLQLLPLPLALQCLFPLLDVQLFRELAGKRYRTPIAVVVEFILVLDVDHSLPVHDLIGESRPGGPPRESGCVSDRSERRSVVGLRPRREVTSTTPENWSPSFFFGGGG